MVVVKATVAAVAAVAATAIAEIIATVTPKSLFGLNSV